MLVKKNTSQQLRKQEIQQHLQKHKLVEAAKLRATLKAWQQRMQEQQQKFDQEKQELSKHHKVEIEQYQQKQKMAEMEAEKFKAELCKLKGENLENLKIQELEALESSTRKQYSMLAEQIQDRKVSSFIGTMSTRYST